MHQQTKLILLLIFLWLTQNAQAQKDKRAENTILKLDGEENPYSESKNRYLINHGFDVESYDWNDPQINLYLKKSLNNRTASNVTLGSGVGLVILNLTVNALGRIAHTANNNSEGNYQPHTTLYWIGGAAICSSVAFRLVSSKQIERANKLKQR
ncbi:MAG: hypothetical protein R8N23_14330 [Reichenbachiella sp.]|uniref:hypothetical protein n=1 Tax=Reichenbachiella sp. TaxID=2184521 RepID=UPI002966A70D|nr:hypothetical protein [Reichenbachiella sp.]MDW3211050.1 hypothetical protein [Reichenbachiella sp.]